ncbi:interleukin-20-like [Paroedura picta]|uniref:interleukin-20-like n=1 Tax=Paroedura picta TaxID=143630 RepID=UPI0040574B91
MKVFYSQSVFLLFTTWALYLVPVIGNRFFYFGPCAFSVNINEIRDGFATIKAFIQARDPIRTTSILSNPPSLHDFQSLDRCCLIHLIFKFYMDKVFRQCETENLLVNRKISGIANSFLSTEKQLRQCEDHNMCNCGAYAMNKFEQILFNYEQMDVTSAATKSLGELDILLDWLDAY